MRKRIKKGTALALALVLTLSTMILSKVQAAISIDTERQCSITFELDSSYPELKELTIPVHLYQVADVNEYGEYQIPEGFESLKLSTIISEITAQEWEEKAREAMRIVEEQQIQPAASGEIVNGTGKIEGLETGMYLVAAESVQSSSSTYTFTPYLISLPNNYYQNGQEDEWVYDITTGLKPGQEDRYGDLIIDKTLTSYNASLGETTFVFSVEAEKEGEIVYSDVVSVVFDGTGTKSVVVKDLPAGAKVTVTEVYSGASYELTTEESQTVEIMADSTAETAFENEYNHQINGGSSVVNHFEYTEPEEPSDASSPRREGTWDWEQQTDSTGTQE
ncbi:MAG: DUF5979 domain-containing protein [Blautia sp.]